MRTLSHYAGVLLVASFAIACGDAAGAAGAAPAAGADTASMQAELERYQATLPEHPTAFDGRFTSSDDVARALLEALATSDTAALLALAVSRAEHAYLVYPESRLMRAPYRQPVDVAWALHATPHAKGLSRLLQRLGGRSLAFRGMHCRPETITEGRNQYRTGCQVRFTVDGGAVEARLFTALVEREGRLNVASYDNDF